MLPPLEFLTLYLKDTIFVLLKNGNIYNGILEGIDNHINILLSKYEKNKDKVLFIRGENICFIGRN